MSIGHALKQGIFVVGAKRTPFGTFGGALKSHTPTDLQVNVYPFIRYFCDVHLSLKYVCRPFRDNLSLVARNRFEPHLTGLIIFSGHCSYGSPQGRKHRPVTGRFNYYRQRSWKVIFVEFTVSS